MTRSLLHRLQACAFENTQAGYSKDFLSIMFHFTYIKHLLFPISPHLLLLTVPIFSGFSFFKSALANCSLVNKIQPHSKKMAPLPTNPALVEHSAVYTSFLIAFCSLSLIPHVIFQIVGFS